MNPFLRAPYTVAGRLAAFAAGLVPPGGGKLQRSFAARAGVLDRMQAWSEEHRSPAAPLIWIHAPSVGEGLMAKPIIDRLRHDRPDAQIAYTFFSPSAEAFAESLRVDVADYLPFDTPDAADQMLDALKPSVVVFSKLDVWPLLVAAASAKHVRLVLTSAALDDESGRRSRVARLLLQDAYAALDAVGAVHADDAARLVDLGVQADRITVTGDVRYDQVWERIRATSPNAERVAALASERFTLVAGSTWVGDETCLFDAWSQIRTGQPDARLIIAPHELSEEGMHALEARSARLGMTTARLDAATPATDVVVVDRMGVLADLYALADISYVGGGFHDAGLHSVVEPAAYGVPVLFGPQHTASRDAALLIGAGGGFGVTDGAALAARVAALTADAQTQTRAGEGARAVIQSGLGAADKSAALILPMLRPLRLSR